MNGSDNLMRVKKEFHMFCNYYIIRIFAQIINGNQLFFPQSVIKDYMINLFLRNVLQCTKSCIQLTLSLKTHNTEHFWHSAEGKKAMSSWLKGFFSVRDVFLSVFVESLLTRDECVLSQLLCFWGEKQICFSVIITLHDFRVDRIKKETISVWVRMSIY